MPPAPFSGATLTAVGLVGDYVSRIYEEIKSRPLYVVTEAINLPPVVNSPERGLQLARRSVDGPAIVNMVETRRCHANGTAS